MQYRLWGRGAHSTREGPGWSLQSGPPCPYDARFCVAVLQLSLNKCHCRPATLYIIFVLERHSLHRCRVSARFPCLLVSPAPKFLLPRDPACYDLPAPCSPCGFFAAFSFECGLPHGERALPGKISTEAQLTSPSPSLATCSKRYS